MVYFRYSNMLYFNLANIPSLKTSPLVFLFTSTFLFLLIILIRENSLFGIYDKISGDVFYRLGYHYLVFSFGLYLGVKRVNLKFASSGMLIIVFVSCLSLFLFLRTQPEFDIITVILALCLALSIMSLLVSTYNVVCRYFPYLFILSSITYELYIIHYSVIDLINYHLHGRLLAYPLVFGLSILLSYIILWSSKLYLLLMKRFELMLLWHDT